MQVIFQSEKRFYAVLFLKIEERRLRQIDYRNLYELQQFTWVMTTPYATRLQVPPAVAATQRLIYWIANLRYMGEESVICFR
jgi:hypothetical protein